MVSYRLLALQSYEAERPACEKCAAPPVNSDGSMMTIVAITPADVNVLRKKPSDKARSNLNFETGSEAHCLRERRLLR